MLFVHGQAQLYAEAGLFSDPASQSAAQAVSLIAALLSSFQSHGDSLRQHLAADTKDGEENHHAGGSNKYGGHRSVSAATSGCVHTVLATLSAAPTHCHMHALLS